MIAQIKSTLNRSQNTIWQDAFGAVCLMVVFFGALHVPAMV